MERKVQRLSNFLLLELSSLLATLTIALFINYLLSSNQDDRNLWEYLSIIGFEVLFVGGVPNYIAAVLITASTRKTAKIALYATVPVLNTALLFVLIHEFQWRF